MRSPIVLSTTISKTIVVIAEIPHEGTAWVLALSGESDELDQPESVEVVQHGPLQVAVRVAYRYRDSHFVQTISLSAGSSLVEWAPPR